MDHAASFPQVGSCARDRLARNSNDIWDIVSQRHVIDDFCIPLATEIGRRAV